MRTLSSHAKPLMVAAVLVILAVASGCAPYSTESSEVGVRTVKFSFTGKRGVEEKVYPPGIMELFPVFIKSVRFGNELFS